MHPESAGTDGIGVPKGKGSLLGQMPLVIVPCPPERLAATAGTVLPPGVVPRLSSLEHPQPLCSTGPKSPCLSSWQTPDFQRLLQLCAPVYQ